MFDKLGGRKLTCALIFGVLVLLNEIFGWKISEDALIMIGVGLGSFIGVEGLADIVSRIKGNNFPIEEDFDDEDEDEDEE